MNFREKLLQVICECYMGMHGGEVLYWPCGWVGGFWALGLHVDVYW